MFKKTKKPHPILNFLIERAKDYHSIEFISSDREKKIKIYKFRESGNLRILVLVFLGQRIEKFLFFIKEKIVQFGKTKLMLRYSLENTDNDVLISHRLDGLKILIEEAIEKRGHVVNV
jgi:hypothetical protein